MRRGEGAARPRSRRPGSTVDYYLLDESLREEERQIRDVVRQFVEEEIVPRAAELWERGEFPLEWARRLGELGLLGPSIPEEYGGAGRGPTAYALIIQGRGGGDPGVPGSAPGQGP